MRGPKAPSVFVMSPIAVKPKLTGACPLLLHSLLAVHCGTPREPRALLVVAVHRALVAVGVLLLLAWPMHRLCRYRHIGCSKDEGDGRCYRHSNPQPSVEAPAATGMCSPPTCPALQPCPFTSLVV